MNQSINKPMNALVRREKLVWSEEALSEANMSLAQTQNFTEEWLLDAIRTVSFCIVEDGPVYAPILERLELELEALRRQNDAVARARRYLAL